jgi:8-oxo-dGTP pyrophosphatase MutT (NUDIX family)
MSRFGSRIFWMVSRLARITYTTFPIFGRIRGSVGIIRLDSAYVAIERSDGFGLSFPGGISWPWEKPETTLRREIGEETGLQVADAVCILHFQHQQPFPTLTYVFEVQAQGELRSSWEGTVRVVGFNELKERVIAQQQPVVEYISTHLEETHRP